MADKKITELTNITGANLVDADEFVVVDISADETKAITLGELKEAFDSGSGFVRITGDTMTGPLDVQSTITSDGLILDQTTNSISTGTSDGADNARTFLNGGGSPSVNRGGNISVYGNEYTTSGGNVVIAAGDALTGGAVDGRVRILTGPSRSRINVDENGDISFYEDTGTTPKFFWDASAESLRLGTYNGGGTPSGSLFVDSNANNHAIHIEETGGGSESWQIGVDTDGDLGFYNSTSTTASVTFDDSGNVGIGTSSPSASIHAYHATTNVVGTFESGDADVYITFADNTTTSDTAMRIGVTGNDMHFSTSATERMRIDSSGNVGIGTSSPYHPIEVAGGNLWIRQDSNSSAGRGIQFGLQGNHGAYRSAIKGGPENYGVTDSGILTFHTQNGYVVSDTPPERMRIDSNGTLLVGKTSTGYNSGTEISYEDFIRVNRTNGSALYVGRNSSDGELVSFRKDGSSVGSIGTGSGVMAIAGPSGNGLSFPNNLVLPSTSTAGAKDASTDLGVSYSRFKDGHFSGTVNAAKVSVSGGQSAIALSSGSDIRATEGSWTGEHSGKIQYHNNEWYLQASTGWNFRNASAVNVMNCSGSGDMTVSSSVTSPNFNTTSDVTLKTNVETLTGSLDAVKAMRGVTYDWIESGNSDVGVIAQEIEEVIPDLVNTNDEGIKSVKYGNIVAVLIEAIKEQQLRIEALEAQLNS